MTVLLEQTRKGHIVWTNLWDLVHTGYEIPLEHCNATEVLLCQMIALFWCNHSAWPIMIMTI